MNKLMKILFNRLMDSADDNGGSGTPAAAPAAAPTADATPQESSTSVDSAGADDGVNWGELSDAVDEPADVSDAWDVETPAAAAVETPAAPATTQPASQAAEPQVQQPVQPEAVATETQTQPELPQPQPQETPEQRQAAENAYLAQLENLYRFDEATTLKVQTEPEKVLPALAARLHLDVMRTVMAQMQGALPQMLEAHTQASTRNAEAQSKFFSAWPELKGHDKQVLEVGAMFRRMNPTASPEEAIRIIGETTMTALGMRRADPAATTQPAVSTQPAAPAFAPAAPGRASSPQAPATVWEELIDPDE